MVQLEIVEDLGCHADVLEGLFVLWAEVEWVPELRKGVFASKRDQSVMESSPCRIDEQPLEEL